MPAGRYDIASAPIRGKPMRLIVAIVMFTFPGAVWGQGQGRSEVGGAIERGLGFLVKDARVWKKEHNCASCHHAALVIWAMEEAKGGLRWMSRNWPG